MTRAANCKIVNELHNCTSTQDAAKLQVSWPRIIATVVGITVLAALTMRVPALTTAQLREWATSLGS